MFNKIVCNVSTCYYNHECDCVAEKVEVGCDCCRKPGSDHETLCCTFRKKAE